MIRESYFPVALEEALTGTRFIMDALELTQCALPISGLKRYLKFASHKLYCENLLASLIGICSGVLNISRDSRVLTSHTVEAIRISNLRYDSGLREEVTVQQTKNMFIKKCAAGTLGTKYETFIKLMCDAKEKISEILTDFIDFKTSIETGKERVNYPYFIVKIFYDIIENFSNNINLIANEKDFLKGQFEDKARLSNFIFFNSDNFSEEDFVLSRLENDIILGKRSFCYPVLLVDFAYRYSLA